MEGGLFTPDYNVKCKRCAKKFYKFLSKAYEIIRSLNVELKEKGFYVLQEKINKTI